MIGEESAHSEGRGHGLLLDRQSVPPAHAFEHLLRKGPIQERPILLFPRSPASTILAPEVVPSEPPKRLGLQDPSCGRNGTVVLTPWTSLLGWDEGTQPLAWPSREISPPPLSPRGRVELSILFRRMQKGEPLPAPPTSSVLDIDMRCREIRLQDGEATWRFVLCKDPDAIVLLDVLGDDSPFLSKREIERSRRRLQVFRRAGPEYQPLPSNPSEEV
jgi:hypothetical protein